MTDEDDLYRLGAGIMLVNREGKVWVGARIDNLKHDLDKRS